MKEHYFLACVKHPRVAPAVMGQAYAALRPFDQFLNQAIHTAKQRQVRYQLPWEKVRNLRTIRLEAVDTVLRVPRRVAEVILKGWSSGVEPDLKQVAFAIDRSVPFRVKAVTPVAGGLRIVANEGLELGESVVWCGVTVKVAREPEPSPPSDVRGTDGTRLTLLADPRAVDDGYWLLVVEGRQGDGVLVVDGEEVMSEAMPAKQGELRLVDVAGRRLETRAGMLRVEELPAAGHLQGDDGVRYRWTAEGAKGRRGHWIQLLAPDSTAADDFLDPRAAFCEGDVREVWTQPRRTQTSTIKVFKVDSERYQLLVDQVPTEKALYLPIDVRSLYLQRRALRQLRDGPLPHHRGLLRLCEDPRRTRWPRGRPVDIAEDGWYALTDPSRSGTDEQRRFVRMALATDDFMLLEGPPGSGKTTAICELIQQLAAQGKRVLLCASTNVATDNVIERLLEADAGIDAVRIGRLDKVDERVQATQLDKRVDALTSAWSSQPAMSGFGSAELKEMAERTVIMAANLTCGTTMGIVNHPIFRGRGEERHIAERPIASMPLWDVLIIDEASKTLIQEFMVPALMAKRWIIVGDVRQLPPFADRADIVANLRDLVDERDRPIFSSEHQRARLLLVHLRRDRLPKQLGLRWLIVEPAKVLDCLEQELAADPDSETSVVRVVRGRRRADGAVTTVTEEELGTSAALRLAAADWVLVPEDRLSEIGDRLPANLLLAEDLTRPGGAALGAGSPFLMRQAFWLQRAGRLQRSYHDRRVRRESITTFQECERAEAEWLASNDIGQEIAWRLTRRHELRRSLDGRERERLGAQLGRLLPAAVDISGAVDEIQDIGLPSILEVLQEGIGEERSKRLSTLTLGLRQSKQAFDERFVSLSFQHRMHPEIASFPRDLIYSGAALKDANTIADRDVRLGWDFEGLPGRRAWAHVEGRENGGENQDEIAAIAELLGRFIAWAKRKGPPKRTLPQVWEVACLSFYAKQVRALTPMLRKLTGDDRSTRFRVAGAPVEIVCGTVDRFQGREADLVALSMRNTGRVGFLDSPNRLNVAVTRARQQLVVFGNANYFSRCRVRELEELVHRSAEFTVDQPQRRRPRR